MTFFRRIDIFKSNMIVFVKKIIILSFLFLGTLVFAQKRLGVNLKHPVYKIIENGHQRGIIENLSSVKPYSRLEIINYLKTMLQSSLTSKYEKRLLEQYILYFGNDRTGDKLDVIRWGNYGVRTKYGSFEFGLGIGLNFREDFSHLKDYYTYNYGYLFIMGDISTYVSYMGKFGGSIVRELANRDIYPYKGTSSSTFGYYDYLKEWEGERTRTYKPGTDWFDHDIENGGSFTGYETKMDISGYFWHDKIMFRMGKFARDWGDNSYGSLMLDRRAREFPGFAISINPVYWFKFSYLFGTLGNRRDEPNGSEDGYDPNKITHQTMFAIQKAEFFPVKYFYFAATASMVGPRRIDAGYLSPFISYMVYETTQAEIDNILFSFNFGFLIPYLGKLHAEVAIDEFQVKNKNPFRNTRNIAAYKVGLDFPIPKLAFSTLSFQYTKIEPFMYGHYPTRAPSSIFLVDTSYRNDGRNLGYYLKPNSDEFLLAFHSQITANISFGAQYKHIRHGDSFEDKSVNVIHGDVDKYLIYGNAEYPEKHFLKDGIYDFTNTLKFYFEYRFAQVPVALGFDYTFSNTYFIDEIGSHKRLPSSYTVNTVGIYLKLFDLF